MGALRSAILLFDDRRIIKYAGTLWWILLTLGKTILTILMLDVG